MESAKTIPICNMNQNMNWICSHIKTSVNKHSLLVMASLGDPDGFHNPHHFFFSEGLLIFSRKSSSLEQWKWNENSRKHHNTALGIQRKGSPKLHVTLVPKGERGQQIHSPPKFEESVLAFSEWHVPQHGIIVPEFLYEFWLTDSFTY